MVNLTEEERREIVRELALELVGHMGITNPPVWVENLLKNPPTVTSDRLSLIKPIADVLGTFYGWSQDGWGMILVPKDMPLVERRFELASQLFKTMTKSLFEQVKGLRKYLVPELGEYAGYFARVFLAPDPLVDSYRKGGHPLHRFAEAFLIPDRIAIERLQDPIFVDNNPLEHPLGFSPS
jgi:hypothetical protein